MGGEVLAEAQVAARGLTGDREWAVYTPDGGIGSGKTTRRFRRVDGLLHFRARLEGAVPVVESPTGERFRADDPGGHRWPGPHGRPLALRRESDVPHHDESPVHLITSSGLRTLGGLLGEPVDAARFRPNVVLDTHGDGFPEDAWLGCSLRLGDDVVLRFGPGMPRCAMVDMAQAGLDRDGRILKSLARGHDLTFGVQASVVRGGTVRVGDPVRLL
jgi:uncharacterized protein YcbX